MPTLVSKDLCCGCSACASSCKLGVLSMSADETGFLFPKIDIEKCVECGLCEKSCPALCLPPKQIDRLQQPLTYIIQHKDDHIRYQSTSGGAFTAIAEQIIFEGGVVFGASLEDDLVVRHIAVETVENLILFRNSKYVQSDINNSFEKARKYLNDGRKVCFSGSPCQINGLKKFLGRNYGNLLTVDFACKAIPSPLIFRKYVELRSSQYGEVKRVVFRDKKRGFSFCTMAIYEDWKHQHCGHSVYRRGSESDEWLRLFLNGKSTRLSCFECTYQNSPRLSDISLGDIWDTSQINTFMNDNKGTTSVAVWSEKGRNFINSINNRIRKQEYYYTKSSWSKPRKNICSPDFDREQFYTDANAMNAKSFFTKYAPNNYKIKAKQFARVFMWKFHIHDLVRGVKHFIIHR